GAELERAVGDTNQPVDLQAERAEDVAHLAVLAFAQADGQPGIGALLAVENRLHRAIEHAVHSDAVFQSFERLWIDLAMHAHTVAPQPTGGGQFEYPRQAAVIGEQEKAFGVDVEPSD